MPEKLPLPPQSKDLFKRIPLRFRFPGMGRRRFVRFAKAARALERTADGKFWKVSGDPSLSFTKPFLSWIRREYVELNKIIREAANRRIFAVLGTAGCGKSMFAVQFALEAAHKGQLLFKKGESVYIIDGVQGDAQGPYHMDSAQIEDLLEDEDSWLVIDGKHEELIDCRCKVLLACSTRRTKLEKQGALLLYLSAWSEREVKQFIYDFEPHRMEYPKMMVPSEARALESFKTLGGVARYVLQEDMMDIGLTEWKGAIESFVSDVDLAKWLRAIKSSVGDVDDIVASARFLDDSFRDSIVHIFARGNHLSFREAFASNETIKRLYQKQEQVNRLYVSAPHASGSS